MTASSILAVVVAQAIAQQPTLAVEHTYLKAKPGRLIELKAYIERNWFAMDAIAVRRGLFTRYDLFESGASANWDIVVVVGYPTPRGYDEPTARNGFAAIRAAHREALVAGRSLRDLGEIVRSERLVIPGAATARAGEQPHVQIRYL